MFLLIHRILENAAWQPVKLMATYYHPSAQGCNCALQEPVTAVCIPVSMWNILSIASFNFAVVVVINHNWEDLLQSNVHERTCWNSMCTKMMRQYLVKICCGSSCEGICEMYHNVLRWVLDIKSLIAHAMSRQECLAVTGSRHVAVGHIAYKSPLEVRNK